MFSKRKVREVLEDQYRWCIEHKNDYGDVTMNGKVWKTKLEGGAEAIFEVYKEIFGSSKSREMWEKVSKR